MPLSRNERASPLLILLLFSLSSLAPFPPPAVEFRQSHGEEEGTKAAARAPSRRPLPSVCEKNKKCSENEEEDEREREGRSPRYFDYLDGYLAKYFKIPKGFDFIK